MHKWYNPNAQTWFGYHPAKGNMLRPDKRSKQHFAMDVSSIQLQGRSSVPGMTKSVPSFWNICPVKTVDEPLNQHLHWSKVTKASNVSKYSIFCLFPSFHQIPVRLEIWSSMKWWIPSTYIHRICLAKTSFKPLCVKDAFHIFLTMTKNEWLKKHEINGVAVLTNYCLNLPGNQF